jgi:NAD(P)-dependent dehydrogenase (short-subunit alcohol dehydrogenase family)
VAPAESRCQAGRERGTGVILEDRVCVISGVGPGLGRQVALAAARQGADLVLGARRRETLEAVAAEVEALGRRAVVVPTDVTDKAQCENLAGTALAQFGRIDALVNNAYASDVFQSFRKVDLDEWRRLTEVNLFGNLQVTKAVVDPMKEAGGGAVVFINSMVIRKPTMLQGGYAVSKGGLLVAARVLASELGKYKIRVNSVLPGWMWGPQVEFYVKMMSDQRGISEQEVIDEITAPMAFGTIPTDEDVAGAVVFLASPLASGMTGQAVDVNGGEVFD